MRKPEPARSGRLIYVLFAGALGLLYLERRSTMTPFEHTEALLAIVLLFFLVIWMWLGSEDRK
jgi:hypothetical protein